MCVCHVLPFVVPHFVFPPLCILNTHIAMGGGGGGGGGGVGKQDKDRCNKTE